MNICTVGNKSENTKLIFVHGNCKINSFPICFIGIIKNTGYEMKCSDNMETNYKIFFIYFPSWKSVFIHY